MSRSPPVVAAAAENVRRAAVRHTTMPESQNGYLPSPAAAAARRTLMTPLPLV